MTADLARALRDELGLGESPPAMTLPGDSDGVPAGSLLPPRERFSGMPAPTHCFGYVDARAPRPFELRAAIMSGGSALRRSLGLGTLLYAVPLRVAVSGRAALGAPRGTRAVPFEGDAAVASRLNEDFDLVQQATTLAPTQAGPDSNHRWAVERLLSIEPHAQGGVLFVRTLHRANPTGWTLGAPAVLELAARVETALG
ncbi:hypothetical protein [Amycolatopsis samaneae]|uniref:Uncharacterized protein n=1 Tax=Amycolatopsis samaneae TaxID=664691 RepID=A0ABW5GC63_9PSEU